MTLFSKKNVVIMIAMFLCITALVATFVPAFSTSFDTLVDQTVDGVNNGANSVYKLINVGAPLALLIVLGIILFSHDSRKVGLLIGIAVTILVAWLISMAVHSGWIGDFLKSIADKYFNGSNG